MEIVSADDIRDWIHAGSPTIGISDLRIEAFNRWMLSRNTYGNDDEVVLHDTIHDATILVHPGLTDQEVRLIASDILNSEWLHEYVRVRQEKAYGEGYLAGQTTLPLVNPYRPRE